jgi:hypothetical protein
MHFFSCGSYVYGSYQRYKGSSYGIYCPHYHSRKWGADENSLPIIWDQSLYQQCIAVGVWNQVIFLENFPNYNL